MKTRIILIAMLLSSFVAAPAAAAFLREDAERSVGINYGANSVLGIQGEFGVTSLPDNAFAQVFCKYFSHEIATDVSWGTTGFGAAALYDFNSVAQLDKEIHPYAGIGLMYVFHSWTGSGPARPYSGGVVSGLYLAAGVRYAFNPKWAADFNYNTFGSLTAGINYSF
jgi:hypothetical protein